jgi:hypothetical protein
MEGQMAVGACQDRLVWAMVAGQRNSAPVGGRTDKLERSYTMSIGSILLIILVLALLGAFPAWPHSKNWGYYPSGVLGTIVLILLILLLMGRI